MVSGVELFQKKNQSEEGGLRVWNFQWYWRNSKCNFQGLIKNSMESLEVIKTKSCGVSRDVLVLGFKIFDGWSFVLSRNSRGKIKNQKNPGKFSKTHILNPPSPFPPIVLFPVYYWVFSGIAYCIKGHIYINR